jgi:hypothetical protein
VGDGEPDDVEVALGLDARDLVPELLGYLVYVGKAEGSRDVDDDVDAPVGVYDRLDEALGVLELRDVREAVDGLAAGEPYGLGGGGGVALVVSDGLSVPFLARP